METSRDFTIELTGTHTFIVLIDKLRTHIVRLEHSLGRRRHGGIFVDIVYHKAMPSVSFLFACDIILGRKLLFSIDLLFFVLCKMYFSEAFG